MEEQEFPITLIYKGDILQDVDFLLCFLLHNQKLRFSVPQGLHVEKLKSIDLSRSNKITKEKYRRR